MRKQMLGPPTFWPWHWKRGQKRLGTTKPNLNGWRISFLVTSPDQLQVLWKVPCPGHQRGHEMTQARSCPLKSSHKLTPLLTHIHKVLTPGT